MAHGLESRVPFVDTAVVELAARLPADVKFRQGHLKHALKHAFADVVPAEILDRRDKMGFPVPLGEWMNGELHDFVNDALSGSASARPYLREGLDLRQTILSEGKFGRNVWALLSLELWQRRFHDQQASWSWPARAADAAPALAPLH